MTAWCLILSQDAEPSCCTQSTQTIVLKTGAPLANRVYGWYLTHLQDKYVWGVNKPFKIFTKITIMQVWWNHKLLSFTSQLRYNLDAQNIVNRTPFFRSQNLPSFSRILLLELEPRPTLRKRDASGWHAHETECRPYLRNNAPADSFTRRAAALGVPPYRQHEPPPTDTLGRGSTDVIVDPHISESRNTRAGFSGRWAYLIGKSKQTRLQFPCG